MADTNHVTVSTLSVESSVVNTLCGSIDVEAGLQGSLSSGSDVISGIVTSAVVERDYEKSINLPQIEGSH